jgi:mannose-6-phosphate isomerase
MTEPMDIYRLENSIQEYEWGSKTAIAKLLGRSSPSPVPQAELWMGAHPKAPSLVVCKNRKIALQRFIDGSPEKVLGAEVSERFSGTLPFLFKVIAAAKPLSIQAHPNIAQAREGFARETERGIPLNAFERSYRDRNHKPEILYALTPFWAMDGFRPFGEMLGLLKRVSFRSIGPRVESFSKAPNRNGLKAFFHALMTLPEEKKRATVDEAVKWAKNQRDEKDTETTDVRKWVLRLNKEYPWDIGVVCPLILNIVHLRPGDAFFTQAGVLHAYLEGAGIELMANSDNVLRGGLTKKFVDVRGLLHILSFEPTYFRKAAVKTPEDGVCEYESPAEEFSLSRIFLRSRNHYEEKGNRSVSILLCTEGHVRLQDLYNKNEIVMRKGESVLVAASAGSFRATGHGVLFRASVPKGGRHRKTDT